MIVLKDFVQRKLVVIGDWYLYRIQRNGGVKDNSKILNVEMSWRIIMNNSISKIRKVSWGAVWENNAFCSRGWVWGNPGRAPLLTNGHRMLHSTLGGPQGPLAHTPWDKRLFSFFVSFCLLLIMYGMFTYFQTFV